MSPRHGKSFDPDGVPCWEETLDRSEVWSEDASRWGRIDRWVRVVVVVVLHLLGGGS